jgi:cell fate (sporulation/competence/biofilm development) regulator YmcA (YheA/YmcA/DUF963 family)
MADEHAQAMKETHEHMEDCGCEEGYADHTVEELVVREDILARTRELARLIGTSEEVTQYRQAEAKLKDNQRVQEMIALLKKKQKELVAFEQTFKNTDMVKKIEGEMNALQDELDVIPLVQQFQQSQVDVNYLLQIIVDVIRDTVAEKLELSE